MNRTQPAYRVGRSNTSVRPKRTEEDIMYEIMTHGPVQGANKLRLWILILAKKREQFVKISFNLQLWWTCRRISWCTEAASISGRTWRRPITPASTPSRWSAGERRRARPTGSAWTRGVGSGARTASSRSCVAAMKSRKVGRKLDFLQAFSRWINWI